MVEIDFSNMKFFSAQHRVNIGVEVSIEGAYIFDSEQIVPR